MEILVRSLGWIAGCFMVWCLINFRLRVGELVKQSGGLGTYARYAGWGPTIDTTHPDCPAWVADAYWRYLGKALAGAGLSIIFMLFLAVMPYIALGLGSG